LRIVNAEKSLIFDEQMLEPGMKFPSSQLEAVYAVPFEDSQVSVIVTNTTPKPIIVNGDAIFAGVNSHHPIQGWLGPHETKMVNLPQGLIKRASAGAVSLNHNGDKGALLAMIHLWDADRGYSEAVNFTNPGGKTTERHGAGLRLGGVDNDPLKAVIAVRNIGENSTTVTATVPYSKQNGDSGTIALPQVSLAPGEIKLLNTSNPQLRQNDFATAGLEIKYTGTPGSVITSASSVSRSGNHVFALPMKDPQGGLSSTGSYPWFIQDTASTVVFIKNVTDEPQDFILSVVHSEGVWRMKPRLLDPRQTIAVDLKKIRDSQEKGVDGDIMPSEAASGHISWGARGASNKKLIGRAQMVDFENGMASTYECQCRCPPSWALGARIVPTESDGFDPIFAGESAGIDIQTLYYDCYGNGPWWFPAFPFGMSLSSTNPNVATFNDRIQVDAWDEGSATLEASWPEFTYYPDICTSDSCNGSCSQTNYTATGVLSVAPVKMDITFGATSESLTQGVKTVIAGQKIDLRLKPTNATNISWTVPGVRVKDWKVLFTPGSTVSTAEALPVGDLNTSTAVFYWVDGELSGVAKQVSVTARIGGKTRTKTAVFNLVKPEALSSATHVGTIEVVNSTVRYGGGTSPGIRFSTGTVIKPTGFDGSTQWVQILRSDREAIDPTGTYRDRRIGNDKDYPYSSDVTTADSPNQALASNTQKMTIADRFFMYLMFKPNIADSIWVPLKKIDWGWNVVVVPTTFSWNIQSQSPTGPSTTSTAEHPIWDKNILGPVFTPVP